MVDLGLDTQDVDRIARVFEEHDRELIIQQHAVHHDEDRLIQSARETAAELETLLNQDLE